MCTLAHNSLSLLGIVYITGVTVMALTLSFFSAREGYNDTELLRFSYFRVTLAYISAAVIFFFLCIAAETYYIPTGENILEYFIFFYYPPYLIIDFVWYSPIIGDIYGAITNYTTASIIFLALTIIIDVIFIILFYRVGRIVWIKRKKDKIKKISKTTSSAETAKQTKVKPPKLNKFI